MTGQQRGRAGQGFTLVELLLAVSVVLLLVGAVVFSFSSVSRGAPLEEGVGQFENLVHLARAHAANTGRRVQMRFEEEVTADSLVVGRVKLLWEPDPLGEPGRYEPLWELSAPLEQANELIALDKVERAGADESVIAVEESETPAWLAPVTFFADGSSDTADVVLVSREAEDTRKMVLHIDGITGSMRRELLAPAAEAPEQETDVVELAGAVR